jgi:hypothetical protein
LDKFESVLGSKPEIDESSVASYNVACCYSKLDRVCLLFHCELLQDCKSATEEVNTHLNVSMCRYKLVFPHLKMP